MTAERVVMSVEIAPLLALKMTALELFRAERQFAIEPG